MRAIEKIKPGERALVEKTRRCFNLSERWLEVYKTYTTVKNNPRADKSFATSLEFHTESLWTALRAVTHGPENIANRWNWYRDMVAFLPKESVETIFLKIEEACEALVYLRREGF